MTLLLLAWRSLASRRFTAALIVFAIAVSVTTLLGVEKVRTGVRQSFASTVSGVDLIVGARGSPTELLLSSVFHLGNPTSGLSRGAYQAISARPEVAWTVPLSLGDSHRGFRVVGTSPGFFEHFRFGTQRNLVFADGHAFAGPADAVIGAEVAHGLGYRPGDPLVVAHGIADHGFAPHDGSPFRVTGVLASTGTPVDRAVFVSLAGVGAMHDLEGEPPSITAILVGLRSRGGALSFQRAINGYRQEPLTAILPGVALQELWDSLRTMESALLAISVMVVATGLLGLIAMSLAALNERRREMAILRAVGARPGQIFSLLVVESALLAVLGAALGLAIVYLAIGAAQPWIVNRYGLHVALAPPSGHEWELLALVVVAGALAGVVPALRAYRYSLVDGMMVQS